MDKEKLQQGLNEYEAKVAKLWQNFRNAKILKHSGCIRLLI